MTSRPATRSRLLVGALVVGALVALSAALVAIDRAGVSSGVGSQADDSGAETPMSTPSTLVTATP